VRIIGSKHLQDGEFDTYCIKDGVIVIKKDAIIKDGTIIP
jgi:glucose-1-phosphate adenylyltransferase